MINNVENNIIKYVNQNNIINNYNFDIINFWLKYNVHDLNKHNKNLKVVASLFNINKLMGGYNITNKELCYIPNVYTLILYWNSYITDRGLSYISKVHTLQIDCNFNITDKEIKCLHYTV